MPFSGIWGQPAAVETLTFALQTGRAHHAYLFDGPQGVGKERAAVAYARSLVCESPRLGLACLACEACRRAGTLSETPPHVPLHPDVVLLERGLYPPDAVGRSRAEVTELSVDQVRTLVLARAAFPPHEGRARVYIVRRADELSTSAANALLKTLEEPGDRTYFVLLTARAERLLPTIRSRTLPVRFAPLPDRVLSRILTEHGIAEDAQADAIELAGGSASAALELCDPAVQSARDELIQRVIKAVRAPDLGAAVALGESADKNREALAEQLRALAGFVARKARHAATTKPEAAGRLSVQHLAVVEALKALEQNASPSLTMMHLIDSMRRAR